MEVRAFAEQLTEALDDFIDTRIREYIDQILAAKEGRK